jgi:hypothetical protein
MCWAVLVLHTMYRCVEGGSTLEEMCDCNVREAYGYRCGCGDPAVDTHSTGRPLNGCCNLGLGSCDDHCAVLLETERGAGVGQGGGGSADGAHTPPVAASPPADSTVPDPPADADAAQLWDELVRLRREQDPLRRQIAQLQQQLQQQQPPPPAPPEQAGDAREASWLADQVKTAALEKAFQLQAISLAQFEAASASLHERASAAMGVPAQPSSAAGDEATDCALAPGCQECRARGCAWCVGGRKCVEDKPWICAGDTDHIGTLGTRQECPSRESLEQERQARRLQEAEAAAEQERLLGPSGGCDADDGGGGSGDGSTGGGGGGAQGAGDSAQWEAERRRAEIAERAGR